MNFTFLCNLIKTMKAFLSVKNYYNDICANKYLYNFQIPPSNCIFLLHTIFIARFHLHYSL